MVNSEAQRRATRIATYDTSGKRPNSLLLPHEAPSGCERNTAVQTFRRVRPTVSSNGKVSVRWCARLRQTTNDISSSSLVVTMSYTPAAVGIYLEWKSCHVQQYAVERENISSPSPSARTNLPHVRKSQQEHQYLHHRRHCQQQQQRRRRTCIDTACPTPASCWYMSRNRMPKGLKFHQLAATTCETRGIPRQKSKYGTVQKQSVRPPRETAYQP